MDTEMEDTVFASGCKEKKSMFFSINTNAENGLLAQARTQTLATAILQIA